MKKVFWTMLTMMAMFISSGCDTRQTDFNPKEEEEISNINEEDA